MIDHVDFINKNRKKDIINFETYKTKQMNFYEIIEKNRFYLNFSDLLKTGILKRFNEAKSQSRNI